MPKTNLYLSPHLDDAVLSCGGRILRDVRRGERVVVATVFSGGDGSAAAEEMYRARRNEDQAALGMLGAEAVWIDLPDAPFRRDYYRSFREIVLEPHPLDANYAAEVAIHLNELIGRLQPDIVLAPLGVIGHIDHRLVHDAAAGLPNVLFYEDRPYCFVRHAVRMRLRELGHSESITGGSPSSCPPDLEPRSVEQCQAEFIADLDRWHWLDTYLPAGDQRRCCGHMLASRFDTPLPPLGIPIRWHWELIASNQWALDAIAAAAQAYPSQFDDLYANREDFPRAATCYTQRIEGSTPYAERYWWMESGRK